MRTVAAVVTDAQGRHLASVPSTSDLEVLEEGAPAEIVRIEPLARERTSEAAVADSAMSPAVSTAPSKRADPTAQVLYVDPQFLYRGSARLYLQTLLPAVEPLTARGPLRIVVARPAPKDLLSPTSDPSRVRAALKQLPRNATGTDSLFESRRRLIDSPQVRGEWEMTARFFIARDIGRIQDSLEKLKLWAATNPTARPTILYLVNDGFELDPTDFYLTCKSICPPQAALERERFRKQFGNRVSMLLNRVSAELVSLGFVVVPLTNGAPPIYEFEGAAQQTGASKNPENRRTYLSESLASAVRAIPAGPSSLAWQPTDPLYRVAEATGGEVVIGEGGLRKALDRLEDAYAISYKSSTAVRSGVQSLEVRARRPGLLVRAARATAGGAFAAEILARGRAAAALEAGRSQGPLSVAVRVEGHQETGKGLHSGTLVVTTDLAAAVQALSKVGAARARVTLAVETDDPSPFLTSQETDVDQSGEGTLWTYEIPMTWPREARRVSVLVEELKTGLFGSAATELPR